jgi:hypothetical protein
MTKSERPSIDEIARKLQPEAIRSNLIRAGLFLAGWEMMKSEILDQVQSFFLMGFNETGLLYSDAYTTRVLARHKSRFEASLSWLMEAGALTETQADQIRSLRTYRNEVAHELPKLLVEPGPGVDLGRVHEMKDLLAVLGRFWGRINVDTNPDFDGMEVNDAGIQSGLMLLMDHLVAAADETGAGK